MSLLELPLSCSLKSAFCDFISDFQRLWETDQVVGHAEERQWDPKHLFMLRTWRSLPRYIFVASTQFRWSRFHSSFGCQIKVCLLHSSLDFARSDWTKTERHQSSCCCFQAHLRLASGFQWIFFPGFNDFVKPPLAFTRGKTHQMKEWLPYVAGYTGGLCIDEGLFGLCLSRDVS